MHTRPGDGEGTGGPVNEVDATVIGGLVQARDVRGGVHLHVPAAGLPRPRQLPGAVALVDRDEALGALDRASAGPPAVAVVTGPAGIGKTAVALHWAHRRLDAFPDGQLYADLRAHSAVRPARPGDVLGGFIRGLGVAADRVPSGLAERAALYRSLTSGRRLLVVLDDAYSVAQVTPLLPGAPGGVAVVTSRWRLAALLVHGARGVQLGPLGADAAMELLGRALGSGRVETEPDMAARLVDLCARSPLALSVAAARLATRPRWPLGEMVGALTEERRRLEVLAARDAEGDMTVRAALELSYRNLPGPARRLYRLLGTYPGRTFDHGVAAALTGTAATEAGERLDELAEVNLLDDAPGARYRFHELTRLHALGLAETREPEHERAAALTRLAVWTAAATLAASRAAAPYRRLPGPPPEPGVPEPPAFDSAAQALGWLDREFADLEAVAERARAAGLNRAAYLIVDGAWPLFLHRGRQARRLGFDRIGLSAARAAGDRAGEAKMLNRTGLALRDLARPDEAARDFLAARDIWRELGDRSRLAGSERRIGLLELDRSRFDTAGAHFRSALGAYRAAGDDRRAALTLCDLAAALLGSGRETEAAAILTAARDSLAAADDPYNQARVLVLLGRARAAEGRGAEELVRRGLVAMREIGSAAGEADALLVLGDLALRDGRRDEALRRYHRAREVLVDAGASTRTLDERLAAATDSGQSPNPE
ncbi:hypothetical protein [Actinomadura sp. NTSP31]|uniref:hypothetical protein n=1 Tax=Actinomadura sp. NTSP31 TaxID=1735447 RepID=UPI0035BF38B1